MESQLCVALQHAALIPSHHKDPAVPFCQLGPADCERFHSADLPAVMWMQHCRR
jgi:hypothetical protein